MSLLDLQGHGNDEFVTPQWAQRLYGSFGNHETYPIKNVSQVYIIYVMHIPFVDITIICIL